MPKFTASHFKSTASHIKNFASNLHICQNIPQEKMNNFFQIKSVSIEMSSRQHISFIQIILFNHLVQNLNILISLI